MSEFSCACAKVCIASAIDGFAWVLGRRCTTGLRMRPACGVTPEAAELLPAAVLFLGVAELAAVLFLGVAEPAAVLLLGVEGLSSVLVESGT